MRGRARTPLALPLLVAGLAAAGPAVRGAAAQAVLLVGRGDPDVDRRLGALAAGGRFRLITRDTVLRGLVPGPLLVLGATAVVGGELDGDLVGVDANLFLRPHAHVRGDVVNAGGGLYRAESAAVDGTVLDRPEARYRVVRGPDTYRIEAQAARPPPVRLEGPGGFLLPTYDRVDGVTAGWGATLSLPPAAGLQPSLRGTGRYRSERGAWDGELAARLGRGRIWLEGGLARATATNDEWIRGDTRNSLSFLVQGKDYRNYYQSDLAYAEVGHALLRPRWEVTTRVRAARERARSLAAGSPFTLFGPDRPRPNPPVDDGIVRSLRLVGETRWRGRAAALGAGAEVELATDAPRTGPFRRFVLWGEWAMAALADHELEVEWRFQGPLPGSGPAPRQRWSFVGGSGTLPTFEIARFRGDRLAFVETTYIVPLPGPRFPLAGPPRLHLVHAAGMAWTADSARSLEQNLGAELHVLALRVRAVANPRDPAGTLEVDLGLVWPLRPRRPWRP